MDALNTVVTTAYVGQDESIYELNDLQLAFVGGGSGIVVVETPPPKQGVGG